MKFESPKFNKAAFMEESIAKNTSNEKVQMLNLDLQNPIGEMSFFDKIQEE